MLLHREHRGSRSSKLALTSSRADELRHLLSCRTCSFWCGSALPTFSFFLVIDSGEQPLACGKLQLPHVDLTPTHLTSSAFFHPFISLCSLLPAFRGTVRFLEAGKHLSSGLDMESFQAQLESCKLAILPFQKEI